MISIVVLLMSIGGLIILEHLLIIDQALNWRSFSVYVTYSGFCLLVRRCSSEVVRAVH